MEVEGISSIESPRNQLSGGSWGTSELYRRRYVVSGVGDIFQPSTS